MNEEILNNIWNILSSDSNLNIKAANFDEWKNSFAQDKNVQTNVYNYLKQNHTLQAANQEEWTTSVMGKTNGTQKVDAPVVPNVSLDVTGSASELSSLGLSGDEFKEYETALNNVFTETEVEMEEVVRIANSAPKEEYLATKGWVGQFELTTVYPFQEFLNEDQSNKEEAKEKWIQQEREKIQTRKLELVYDKLKSDVMPLWTGPVGFADKIIGGFASLIYQPNSSGDLTPVIKDSESGEYRELTDKELKKHNKDKVSYDIETSSGYTKKELEYERVRNILHGEYVSKLNKLDADGEKTVNNINYSISQFDIIDAEINRLNGKYKTNPPSSQAEVDYFNGLLGKRKALYVTYKSNLEKLNQTSVDLESIGAITDMVKRTYSEVQVMDNLVTSAVLKLQSGLLKTAKELTVGVEERYSDIDLNSEENLELVSDFMRPLARGMGNLGDAMNKKSLELFEESEKINEFTRKRQELGEVKSFEDFSQFMLELFSEQAVNTAITASTGGLGLIAVAAGATGNKFTSMDMELENGRYNPRTGKMEKVDISMSQYYVAGMGYGLAEYVTEKVSLANLKLGASGFRKALDIAGGKYTLKDAKFPKALKNYGMSTLGEGSSELFASIFQNSLDRHMLENKEVGILDGASEAFWSGAFMSGLGFNAPALAAAGYRAATPSKGWDKINENAKKILELSEVYDQIILGPRNQETLDQAKAVREQMDNLLRDNIVQKGLAEQRIDQLSNNEKRTLLDLESKRNRLAARIDKLSEGKNADSKYVKDMVNAHVIQINNLESKKDAILNSAMYSSDMRKTTKLTLKDAILKGLNIKSIEADNNEDALKQALAHIDQSDLEADQKKALKDKLKQTFSQVDVHVHGFAVGKEQGLPIQFQMKSNATNAQSGNASVHSHELGHNSIFAKIIEGNGDVLGLVDQFEKYIRNRFTGLSETIDQEGRFQLTQYATDAKTVKEELKKELGKEPTEDQINDRIYLNKVSIAEEKLAVATDYIRKYHNEKIDKSFKGKLLDMFSKTRNTDDVTEIQNGEDVYSMLTSFTAGFEKGEMSGLAAKVISGKVKARARDAKKVEDTRVKDKKSVSKDKTNAVNELADMGWTNKTWKEQGADFAIKEMQSNKMLDGLIRSKYKADIVPDNFVDLVYSELVNHVKNFKPEQNDNLFGWINSQIANKAGNVYNREFKVADEMKGAKDIGKTTKEGEVKVQVAAEKSAEMEAFEEEDLSPAAQAKKKADKAKGKEKVESEFRRKIGIETGSELYNKVLDSARKALLRAYEAGTSVRNIQRKLRDEANVYLFKSVKNFLGTKDYVKNLKKFREPIVKAIFTADLVQLERNVADSDRILTTFVKKLTSKKDVEDAVNQKLLPPSALNIIDKGTAVSLYKKKTPTEKQFLSFFYTPLINPVTGSRSGLRGTRKDGLAKAMAGALSYDATMEVAQEQDIIEKREQLAALKSETLAQDNLETLAAAIGRDPNVKFSKSNENRIVSNMAGEILSLVNEMSADPSLITFKNGVYKINQNIIKKWTRKANFKKSDEAIIAEFAYKMHRDNTYDKLTNFELAKKVLKNVIKARKNKYDLKVNQAFEQLVISSLQYAVKNINSKLKTNKKVREGVGQGDAYISFNRNILGIEVKMNEADGVSQTVNIKVDGDGKYSLTYANPNPTINENKQKFDDLIGKKILDATEQLNSDLKKAGLGQIAEDTKLTKAQIKFIEDNVLKTHFLQHMEISPEYAMWHYGNAKYQNKPQGFIQVGESLYRMITGNSKIDGLSFAIQQEYKGIIPDLSMNSSSTMEMVARLKIDNGKLKWRISPRIIDTQLAGSKVNLLNSKDANAFVKAADKVMVNFSKSQDAQTIGKAVQFSRSANNPTKGITVLDFDDTLATSKSMIRFTRPDGTKGKLNAEQYASTYQELSELGYKWDFSEFTKVVDGKTAPLFNKAMKLQGKFGPENMFVLTARPAESAAAIHAFLKANGLNIPLKNITGLANSTAEAKALWIADKVGEGYNDFYFADDALQNVQAVQNMLDQFDVKSKVQQARVKFSKNMNTEFNKVLERTTGVDASEIISGARAAKRGASKGKYKFFVPPSADDFKGLLYYFVGKGKQGEKDMAFLKKALTDPLNRAYTEFNAARQSIANDYRNLKKQMPDVKNKLLQKTPDGDFTYGDAVRVYLWNKAGFDVPGLNQKDVDNLVEMVTSDPQLMIFAYKLGKISKRPEGYTNPTEHWQVGDIRNDLADATGRVGRKEFFTEFIENAEQVFGKMVNGKLTGDNINKIEAIYGSNFREALEDILYATYTGSSRPYGSNRMVNGFTNWINGSVGAVMFVNMRSALLQQMSSVNFLNWGDNNIFKAGLAFANFPQYIKDWAMIFNSDKLKQRRSGLSMDINANELATYLGKSKSKPAALLSWLLQKGFLPTQVSDSIAIANGGAGFYRNRVNTYLKQGFKQKEAEEKAWNDFSEIAEETQQSARPDMVSQQQRIPIGKWFLNFLNTPMQYSRIMKKAMLDLVNRRGDAKTHISRIIYYGAAQNAIFYTLQTGLFAAMFDDDDEEAQKFFDTKAQMTANSMADGLLKGLGFGGAAISTVKNAIIKWIEEDRKGYKGKPAEKVGAELINFSPVVGIKYQKITRAIERYSWDKELVKEMETFDIDNPIWGVGTGIIEGATNVPLNRLYRKVQNLRAATDADREAWQRLALVSGWSVWNIGEQNKELEKLKDEIKARKKKNKKKKKPLTRQQIRIKNRSKSRR